MIAQRYADASKSIEIKFNISQLITVSLTNSFGDRLYFDVRKYFEIDGSRLPTKVGLRLCVDGLPKVRECLKLFKKVMDEGVALTEKIVHNVQRALIVSEIKKKLSASANNCEGCISNHPA